MDNPINIATLAVFFVIQGLLYIASRAKLAEISRQNVPARLKLRLLDNEDHLFDAGLYLGFVGTIISLILVSMGVIKFSLMAAYSSTSFGIIFVSIFKIFHLRGARRLLVDSPPPAVLRFPDRLPERQARDEGPGAHRRCHMIGPWRRTYEFCLS